MTIERINELTPREAILVYSATMTAWIVLFAGTETELPAVVVLLLLLVPLVVHFGLGYVVDDWKALCFTAVPVVVAAFAAAGVYVRSGLAWRDPTYVDPWLI